LALLKDVEAAVVIPGVSAVASAHSHVEYPAVAPFLKDDRRSNRQPFVPAFFHNFWFHA
jgi:hypothetical protein